MQTEAHCWQYDQVRKKTCRQDFARTFAIDRTVPKLLSHRVEDAPAFAGRKQLAVSGKPLRRPRRKRSKTSVTLLRMRMSHKVHCGPKSAMIAQQPEQTSVLTDGFALALRFAPAGIVDLPIPAYASSYVCSDSPKTFALLTSRNAGAGRLARSGGGAERRSCGFCEKSAAIPN